MNKILLYIIVFIYIAVAPIGFTFILGKLLGTIGTYLGLPAAIYLGIKASEKYDDYAHKIELKKLAEIDEKIKQGEY